MKRGRPRAQGTMRAGWSPTPSKCQAGSVGTPSIFEGSLSPVPAPAPGYYS